MLNYQIFISMVVGSESNLLIRWIIDLNKSIELMILLYFMQNGSEV